MRRPQITPAPTRWRGHLAARRGTFQRAWPGSPPSCHSVRGRSFSICREQVDVGGRMLAYGTAVADYLPCATYTCRQAQWRGTLVVRVRSRCNHRCYFSPDDPCICIEVSCGLPCSSPPVTALGVGVEEEYGLSPVYIFKDVIPRRQRICRCRSETRTYPAFGLVGPWGSSHLRWGATRVAKKGCIPAVGRPRVGREEGQIQTACQPRH